MTEDKFDYREGLSDEVLDAIDAKITRPMVRFFVGCLDSEPQSAEIVRMKLFAMPWFPRNARRDTQLRFIRSLRDAAIDAGHPVCSVNTGYLLGDKRALLEAASRARNLAEGATARAQALERLAQRIAA